MGASEALHQLIHLAHELGRAKRLELSGQGRAVFASQMSNDVLDDLLALGAVRRAGGSLERVDEAQEHRLPELADVAHVDQDEGRRNAQDLASDGGEQVGLAEARWADEHPAERRARLRARRHRPQLGEHRLPLLLVQRGNVVARVLPDALQVLRPLEVDRFERC